MFKVQTPGYRTRTVKTERAALIAASRIIATEYDGATGTSVACLVTRPDGSSFTVTDAGKGVCAIEVAA